VYNDSDDYIEQIDERENIRSYFISWFIILVVYLENDAINTWWNKFACVAWDSDMQISILGFFLTNFFSTRFVSDEL